MLLPPLPEVAGSDFACRPYQGSADLRDIDCVRAAIRTVEPHAWLPGPDTSGKPELEPFCLIGYLRKPDDHIYSPVAYTWMQQWSEADGTRLWLLLGWVDPAARRRGVGRVLLAWQEQAALAHAVEEYGRVPEQAAFGGNADDDQPAARDLLLAAGYRMAFTVVNLACDPAGVASAAPVALPDGLTERPLDHDSMHPRIHAAIEEAFQHSRNGHVPRTFEQYLHEVESREADTDLWCVAWDGDEVAGVVVVGTRGDGSREIPWVAVRPAWRRRGLAEAMLRRVLARCAAAGVCSLAIATVQENQNQTVALYQKVGFQVVRRSPRYRKPCPTAPSDNDHDDTGESAD